jgi:hypothetical protein
MPCGSIRASPSICRPPQMPSTAPPCRIGMRTIARSRPWARSQARSAAGAALEPGRMIQSSGPAAVGRAARPQQLHAGHVAQGWNSSRLLMRGNATTAMVVATGLGIRGARRNRPSSSGRPCCHHIGSTATVGTPVRSCSICGAGCQQGRVATELVQHEAFDARTIGLGQQRPGAVQVGKGAAAVDVGDQQARGVAVPGHAQVHDVAVGQVDLGG